MWRRERDTEKKIGGKRKEKSIASKLAGKIWENKRYSTPKVGIDLSFLVKEQINWV